MQRPRSTLGVKRELWVIGKFRKLIRILIGSARGYYSPAIKISRFFYALFLIDQPKTWENNNNVRFKLQELNLDTNDIRQVILENLLKIIRTRRKIQRDPKDRRRLARQHYLPIRNALIFYTQRYVLRELNYYERTKAISPEVFLEYLCGSSLVSDSNPLYNRLDLGWLLQGDKSFSLAPNQRLAVYKKFCEDRRATKPLSCALNKIQGIIKEKERNLSCQYTAKQTL